MAKFSPGDKVYNTQDKKNLVVVEEFQGNYNDNPPVMCLDLNESTSETRFKHQYVRLNNLELGWK